MSLRLWFFWGGLLWPLPTGRNVVVSCCRSGACCCCCCVPAILSVFLSCFLYTVASVLYRFPPSQYPYGTFSQSLPCLLGLPSSFVFSSMILSYPNRSRALHAGVAYYYYYYYSYYYYYTYIRIPGFSSGQLFILYPTRENVYGYGSQVRDKSVCRERNHKRRFLEWLGCLQRIERMTKS